MTTQQEPLCPRCGSDKWQWHSVSWSSPSTYKNLFRCLEKYCRAKWVEHGRVKP